MKTVRVEQFFFLACTLLFSISLYVPVYATEIENSDLIISHILSLPTSSLIEKNNFLNLPPISDRNELIAAILTYYGFSETQKEGIEREKPYLQINQADSFFVHEQKDQVILDGSVSIDFEDNSLQAQTIIFNRKKGYLYAIGNVVFEQNREGEVEVLTSNSLILNTRTQEIVMNQGIIRSESLDEDGKETQFLSRGEKITLSQDPPFISVADSSLTTSVDEDYYQIRSKNFYVIDNNDLFLSSSFLYIGRVPILYIPFFFYPGKTLTFNPSFGYDSQRGVMVFTSYELYGKNPLIHEKEEKGITSFLTGEQPLEKGSMYTYEAKVQPNPSQVEQWALSSSSYATLYGDFYQHDGIFLGLESENSFPEAGMKASMLSGVAYKNPSTQANKALFRYLIHPTFSYKKDNTSLSFSLPFYSDSEVKKDYLQRDIRTRLLELASINTKEENKISSINSFTWELKGSTSISPELLAPYINSIDITTFQSNIRFEKESDPTIGGFVINDATPIDIRAKMSGTLVQKNWKGDEKGEKTTYTSKQVEQLKKYQLLPKDENSTTLHRVSESFLKINYEIKQDFKWVFDYTKGLRVDTITKVNNRSFIELESRIGPKIVTFNHKITSLLSNTTTDTKESKQYDISSDNTITLPFLNISYTLNQRLYRNSYQKENSFVEENKGFTTFSSDDVKIHSLSYNPTYKVGDVELSPSVTFTLFPLDVTFTPKLGLQYKKISSSISVGVKENESDVLTLFRGNFTFSYKGEILNFSNSAQYSKTLPTNQFYKDLTIDSSLKISLFDAYLTVDASGRFKSDNNSFDKLTFRVSAPFIDLSIKGTQVNSSVVGESLDVKLINSLEKKLWWKNRISLSYNVIALYHHSFVDSFGSYASIDFSLTLDIYKFLSIKTSLKSVNRGLYRYNTIQDFIEDLLKSFDFFGNGRNTTQFIMDSFSLSLIHYMDDWNLYVTYEARVENVNNRLVWSPVVKFLVKWNAISEIKVDREVKL